MKRSKIYIFIYGTEKNINGINYVVDGNRPNFRKIGQIQSRIAPTLQSYGFQFKINDKQKTKFRPMVCLLNAFQFCVFSR